VLLLPGVVALLIHFLQHFNKLSREILPGLIHSRLKSLPILVLISSSSEIGIDVRFILLISKRKDVTALTSLITRSLKYSMVCLC